MINLNKYNGDYQELARIVNKINQRVRVLERQGYQVSGVSQNAELYNDPSKFEKLMQKYNEIMSPDYVDKLHEETIKTMESNLKEMFDEDIEVDLTPNQLKEFIKQYPEYSSLTIQSPNRAKQEMQKVTNVIGGTKEGIINALDSMQDPSFNVKKPQTFKPKDTPSPIKRKRRSMSKSKSRKGRR